MPPRPDSVPALSEDAWNLVQIKRKEEEAEEAAWAAQDEAAAAAVGDADVRYGHDDGDEEEEGREYYGNEEEEEYEEELMRQVGPLLVLALDISCSFYWHLNDHLDVSRVPVLHILSGYAENRLTKVIRIAALRAADPAVATRARPGRGRRSGAADEAVTGRRTL